MSQKPDSLSALLESVDCKTVLLSLAIVVVLMLLLKKPAEKFIEQYVSKERATSTNPVNVGTAPSSATVVPSVRPVPVVVSQPVLSPSAVAPSSTAPIAAQAAAATAAANAPAGAAVVSTVVADSVMPAGGNSPYLARKDSSYGVYDVLQYDALNRLSCDPRYKQYPCPGYSYD